MNQGQLPSEDKTYKRKRTIINVAYFLMIFGASILFVRYALPHLWAFVIAFIVIMILRRPAYYFFHRKLKLDYRASSVVLVLLFYGTIGVAVSLLTIFLVNKIRDLVIGFPDFFNNTVTPLISTATEGIENFLTEINEKFGINLIEALKPAVSSSAIASSGIAAGGEAATSVTSSAISGEVAKTGALLTLDGLSESVVSMLTSTIASITKTVISSSPTIATSVSSIILNVTICIISTAFGLMDFDLISAWTKKQIKEEKYLMVKNVLSSLGKLIRKYVVSYGLIMLITFAELAVGLLIIKQDTKAIGIAAIIAVFDILPIIGSGLFLFPWAVISLFTGDVGVGIGLLILWFILIVVRNIIEPKIVGDNVGMHPLITLIAMIVGEFIYGGIGILLLPVSLALIQDLNEEGVIHLYKPLEKKDYKPLKRGIFIGKIINFTDGIKDKIDAFFTPRKKKKKKKSKAKKAGSSTPSTDDSVQAEKPETGEDYYPSSDFGERNETEAPKADNTEGKDNK